MIELTFLKELMLIKVVHQKRVIFVTIDVYKHHLSNIAISNIKGSDYRCIITLISKKEVINLMQNAYLTEKSGTL